MTGSLQAHLVVARDVRDSGAACVATVLSFLGRATTLGEVRGRCGGAARNSVATLTQVGRTFGLEMVALQVAPESFADVPLPTIVQRGDRFVLLERRRRGRYDVLDPTSGWRSRVRGTELAVDPQHMVLTATPGPEFFREQRDQQDRGWRILLRQALQTDGFRSLLAGMIGLSLLAMVVGLTGPVLTALLIDQVLPARLPGVLLPLAVGLALLTLTTFLAAVLRGRLAALMSGRLDNRLMTALFAHMMALPYRFFRERSTGDLVQRFSSNTVIRNVLTGQTVTGLLAVVQVAVYGVALLVVSPVFGLCALVVGAIEVAVLVLPARKLSRLSRRELEQVADTQSFTVEVANGAAYLKASGREAGMLTNWAVRLHGQLDASMRRQRFAAAVTATTTTVAAAATSVLLLVAVALVLDGALTLGVALASLTLAAGFLQPTAQLVSALQSLQAVQGHVQRISAVLEEPVDQAEQNTPPLPPMVGRIQLAGISFRYSADGPWALRDVSIDVPAGSRVAIVGGSGSGKSTLSGVLLGLHPPDEGAVLVDGLDLHAHDLGSFRRQCGVVLQEPVVFQGTVRDNVAFGDDEVSEDDVLAAVRTACLEDDVAKMPHGIDTVIGERGGTVSGGQRQRLALARAFVGRPALLVLDEATSALDNVTEAAITTALRASRTTTVVIAHRLSTVRDADQIVVLDGGRVVQRGTHDELIAADGVYRRLVATGSVSLSAKQDEDADMPVAQTPTPRT